MIKPAIMLRASFMQLKIYFWIVLGVVAVSVLTDLIVNLSVPDGDNTEVSPANLLIVFLIFVGSVIPARFFKRIMNLGASREQYYIGALQVYGIAAVLFAAFNTIWLQLEIGVIRHYEQTFNILEIFKWDRFGAFGMFVYQAGVYLLLISVLNLLFSGLRHAVGWVLWVALVAAIPIFTSIAPLRHRLADGLQALLLNDSLLQGFGLCLFFSCVFLLGGWLFTARRKIM